jgi:ribosomal protein S18 acetylase RimI-like enzyme
LFAQRDESQIMVITLNRRNEENGLRPLIPSRDLQGVALLIEEAFATELDRSGRVALREMRMMGRWGFLFGWLDVFSPDVNTHLNGFVWLEDGRIVGNVTVSRSAPGGKHWFISNVAVAKTHRGRGIARALMTAALEYVKEMHGNVISLQVRQGNQPAIKLYESFGFRHISATSYLYLPRIGTVPYIPLPYGIRLREHNLDLSDASMAYAMARETIPINVQQERPLRQSQFRVGSEIRFTNFWRRLAGLKQIKHYVIEQPGGKFVATLGILAGAWRGDHKVSLMVHPDWWNKLEKPLISFALLHLKSNRCQAISFQHPDEHQPGIEAFKAFNFTVQRTHIWMKLNL